MVSETQPRTPTRAFWGIILTLLLFVFGSCAAGIGGIVYWLNRDARPARAQPARSNNLAITAAVAPIVPAPQVIIATPEGGSDYETAVLMNIYEQVNPSVVNVSIFAQNSSFHDAPVDGVDENDYVEVGGGSGFVWDNEGHIVTNEHVVANAEQVHVRFSDGTTAIAVIIGADDDSDLAVIKIDPTGYTLRPVQRGNIDTVRVGMRVAAIGNPFGYEGTLTSGIVSAIGRSIPSRDRYSIPDSIQTDAPINPGNSGGPLLNEKGEVIGVNAQIRSEERANSGVGFAIPIAIVDRVVPALIANGEYRHSYMGVSGATFSPLCADELGLEPTLRGALVVEILARTPAARAGLRNGASYNTQYPGVCPQTRDGDLITAINGQPVASFDDVLIYLTRFTSPGDTITLSVLRQGEALDVELTLSERP